MEYIKEAFQRVKYDIDLLKEEISIMKSSFNEIIKELSILNKQIKQNKEILTNSLIKNTSTQKKDFSASSTHPSTHNTYFKPLKPQNLHISTGNEGVSTNRQTDKQTNRQTQIEREMSKNNKFLENQNTQEKFNNISNQNNKFKDFNNQTSFQNNLDNLLNLQNNPTHDYSQEKIKNQDQLISDSFDGRYNDFSKTNTQNIIENKKDSIDNAIEVLNSLDHIKKEIRLKFKRLTDQEFSVFSALYELDEEIGHTNYKTLSNKLNLTQSSIRDYIGRLIKKGIPIKKNKINNKNIQLTISKNLKKIATLPTILKLRDL